MRTVARDVLVKCSALVAAVLLFTGPPAMAADGLAVTIDAPVEGAVVDRGGTPTLEVSGSAQFETPEPAERTFYVRAGCSGDTGEPRLSVIRGESEGACVPAASVTPIAEIARALDLSPTAMHFRAVDGVPFALDASRLLTGVVTMVSYCCEPGMPGVGAGQTTVDITVTGWIRDRRSVSSEHVLGNTSVTYTATPLEMFYQSDWAIDLPARFDRKDVWGLTLTLDVHGVNAMHGFVASNLTYLTSPIYDASFIKRVDIAVDDAWFRSDDVTMSADGSNWTAAIPAPRVGHRTIRARAVQGGEASPIAERTITIVD